MADKSVGELIAAQSVTPTDLFVLEQNGTAKKLTGQILENWLVSFADGHGGIHSIGKLSTNVLADTYRITLADTTTFDFVVTNGRGITGISKTSTSGLVDTYTISYNNGTISTFTVKNGEQGDKGDNAYVWIKYASQEPTEASHSMGDLPDDWIGIYSGNASTAPTDWKQYKWFQIKGEKGNPGNPATLASKSVTYQSSDSGTIIPSGAWGSSIPVVSQGKYLWTKTEVRFNTGDPIVSYSVARMGIDGSGAVSSVAGVSPDATGNVTLTAADVGALAVSGGDMEGAINMNGQPISGLNDPVEDTQAARKGYVDATVRKAAPRNLLDNSDFTNPVNQRGATSYAGDFIYTIDRWVSGAGTATLSIQDNGVKVYSGSGSLFPYIFQRLEKLRAGTYTFAAKFHSNTSLVAISNYSTDNGAAVPTTDEENGIIVLTFTTEEDFDQNKAYFRLQGASNDNSVVWEWAALYSGVYTAATMPEYQPKGYGAELAECQRYFNKSTVFARKTADLLTYPLCNHEYPVKMRINPTVTFGKVLTYATASDTTLTARNHDYNDTKGINCIILSGTPVTNDMMITYEASADL